MDVLVIIEALFLFAVSLFTLSFVISSIWEKAGRAALIGGVAFLIPLAGLIGLLALRAAGFFQSTPGPGDPRAGARHLGCCPDSPGKDGQKSEGRAGYERVHRRRSQEV